MRTFLQATAAAAAVLLVAATPTVHGEYHPVYNAEAQFAHCGAAGKATTERTTYAMNTTAPSTSFTANGGCGTFDSDKTDGGGIVLTGTHTGNLETLTAQLWIIDAGPVRVGAFDQIYADLHITIDGRDYYYGELKIVPNPSATGLARSLDFTLTGIGLNAEADYKAHEVVITMETGAYLDGDQIAWVLDASEVPTGVAFSPASPKGMIITPNV